MHNAADTGQPPSRQEYGNLAWNMIDGADSAQRHINHTVSACDEKSYMPHEEKCNRPHNHTYQFGTITPNLEHSSSGCSLKSIDDDHMRYYAYIVAMQRVQLQGNRRCDDSQWILCNWVNTYIQISTSSTFLVAISLPHPTVHIRDQSESTR